MRTDESYPVAAPSVFCWCKMQVASGVECRQQCDNSVVGK